MGQKSLFNSYIHTVWQKVQLLNVKPVGASRSQQALKV